MSRIVITKSCTLLNGTVTLRKGDVIEATAAQLAAITAAGGTSRAVATSTMRDQLGLSGGPAHNNEFGPPADTRG